MITGNSGASDPDWRAAADGALQVLHEALTWQMPGRRWLEVERAVTDMTASVAATSLEGVLRTTTRLDLCGGLSRATTRMGDTPELPAPVAVRERIAELIDTLTPARDRETSDRTSHEPPVTATQARDAGQPSPHRQ